MKIAGSVDFRNGARIVTHAGKPPRRTRKKRGAPAIDVISLRFQRGKRWNPETDSGIYMTPDEAAWAVTLLGRALNEVTRPLRHVFARRAK